MTEPVETRLSRRRRLLLVFVLAVVGGLTAVAALCPDCMEADRFRRWGYVGVFLAAFLGSSTVIFPVPHLAFTFAMGAVLSPLLVGIVAGVGDTLGELWGYLLGYSLESKLRSMRIFPQVCRWMERNGAATLFVLALFPVPFFDVAGLVGGSMSFPVWKFLGATWLGKTLKALIFAWGGYHSLNWFLG